MKLDRALAYALLRLAMGVNFFGHGFFRILSGVGAFASHTAENMGKGPLPHALTLGFAYAIPFLEIALGVLLILGLGTRLALLAGSLFTVALTFGTTSIQNWAAAGDQLVYSAVFFALFWLVDANTLSLDDVLRRRNASHAATTV